MEALMEKSSTNGEQSWVLYKKYMVISKCLLSKFVLLTLKLPNAFEFVKFEGLWQQFATFVSEIPIYIYWQTGPVTNSKTRTSMAEFLLLWMKLINLTSVYR